MRMKTMITIMKMKKTMLMRKMMNKLKKMIMRKKNKDFFILFLLSFTMTTCTSGNKRYGHTARTFSRLIPNILISEIFISRSSEFEMI